MADKKATRIEGIPEAQQAFANMRGYTAKQKAALAESAGEELVGYLGANSRVESGNMAAGWGVTQVDDGAAFINSVDYWTFQEFGTQYVEPMHLIPQAWAKKEDAVLNAYNEGIQQLAEDVGFEQ